MDTTDYNYGQSSKNGNVVKCPLIPQHFDLTLFISS